VSQLDAERKVIGGKTFEMYMLPPMESHELLMDVAKMVGPSLGPVLDKLFGEGRSKGEILEQELGAEFFTKAASALFAGLDKKVLADVMGALRKVTFVDGACLDGTFDVEFKGNLDSMYKWLFFGMNVQWGKSLGALVSAVPALPQGAKEESPSPKT
jgi:hypothetical protein